MHKIAWLSLGFVFLTLAFFIIAALRTSRAAYESAPYRVVRSAGDFEVRDYPALNVAATETNTGDVRGKESFIRLFGFIAGQNESKKKISMTTPVFTSGEGAEGKMSFVMPATLSKTGVPRPLDRSVALGVLPAARYATFRYSGARSKSLEQESLQSLKTWMAGQGLTFASPPIYAVYDPPWTPGFLRRNEVMLRIENQAPCL